MKMTEITAKEIESVKEKVNFDDGKATIYKLEKLEEMGLTTIAQLPYSIRVLLENVLRNFDGKLITAEDVLTVAKWPKETGRKDIPYMPSRVVLQDFTGVPLIVDFAAMRDAISKLGKDAELINPVIPTDLVVDHSVQVDYFGVANAYTLNLQKEYGRNKERYMLLKWAQRSFKQLNVVPPGTGIIHQVNLEYLSRVVDLRPFRGELTAFPDTLLGTDSHTPMVNGVGVMGWGVGGIEAEAVMLGLPYYMLLPEVIGVRLVGELQEGATATDLVLTVTQLLRKKNVVGKFVEYFGPGLSTLSVPDRATLSNMSPEYGATMGFFPVDSATLSYLSLTGRDHVVPRVEKYTKLQAMFREDDAAEPTYSDVVELDLSTVEPSLAGPAHPEDRFTLKEAKQKIESLLKEHAKSRKKRKITVKNPITGATETIEHENEITVPIKLGTQTIEVGDASTVIAAITSCTNTSNPSVMIAAGLLAKKAVSMGLQTKSHVKTSFAPGSRVVMGYLEKLGLTPYLEALRFHLTGYGCTVCIGNSGPLPKYIEDAIKEYDLYAVSVLSGNRNFGGRIHSLSKGNFLASPPLVVAYALAGTMKIDLYNEPIGYTPFGTPVYLKDIWPSQEEIKRAIEAGVTADLYREKYKDVLKGDDAWQNLTAPESTLYQWDENSTYIRSPPYFENFTKDVPEPSDIKGAHVLVLLEDRVSTDHISPAGQIAPESPAGKYLIEKGVDIRDFNTYGSRRGNHEVMMRGTFANVRVKNLLVPEKEGWWTKHIPSGLVMSTYEAAMKYKTENIPVIILAGKQYGVGSSRDWAAKGPALLGVKAVIAESYERIHRSNLVGMGVLPLQFEEGQGWKQLGLDGTEKYDIIGISEGLSIHKKLKVIATKTDGSTIEFNVIARLDAPIEIEYYRHGGIMPYIVRTFAENH